MDQQDATYYEYILLLGDYLEEGIEQKWTHELRKKTLLLLHKLKNSSRNAENIEIESELMAIEVTLGYGSGSSKLPNTSLVEDHQIRLLELAELMHKGNDAESTDG